MRNDKKIAIVVISTILLALLVYFGSSTEIYFDEIFVGGEELVTKSSSQDDVSSQKQILPIEEFIISDLKLKYNITSDKYNKVLNSITILKDQQEYVIATVSFSMHEKSQYEAFLYVFKEGILSDKIVRSNYKYHPGFFELSNNLQNVDLEIKYKVLLPTASVLHSVKYNEFFKVNDGGKIVSLLDFYNEERDCTMGREKGELIKRKLIYKNDNYSLSKSVYQFDCDSFEFGKEIKELKFVSQEIESLKKNL